MNYRVAVIEDIPQMQMVRNSVKENVLSNPALVSYSDYEEYLTKRGKGWVCEEGGRILGFSVVDMLDKNIWALFVLPEFEKMGIGKKLHQLMLDWYFNQTKERVWLSTAPQSRAESFYRKAGWKETGLYGKGEIKFEMSYDDWCNNDLSKARHSSATIKIQLVPVGSSEYEKIKKLRVEELLSPVGVPASFIVPEQEKNDVFIGAMENDNVIGCCILTPKDTSIIQLRQMVVHPSHQGKGIGAAIIDFAEQFARASNYKILMMHARDTAIEFYTKCGYVVTGEMFFEVGIGHHQMQKVL